MIVLGLTGSIAMGKSTAARLFAEEGVPVHDADAAVHRLYAGEAAPLVELAFPGATSCGVVDRKELGKRVLDDAQALARLEGIVHPLVRAAERRFLAEARDRGAPLVVLDVPLLFETGRRADHDAVVVVTTSADEQRRRALERPGMTEESFRRILARQTPDAEKRAKADFVIDSSHGIEAARRDVRRIIRLLGGATE